MISLEQVLLLQKKVETAVVKIRALNAQIETLTTENNALKAKCASLTNELSEKTGQVTSLEAAQNRIEESILQALGQLDTVEHALLDEGQQNEAVSANENQTAPSTESEGEPLQAESNSEPQGVEQNVVAQNPYQDYTSYNEESQNTEAQQGAESPMPLGENQQIENDVPQEQQNQENAPMNGQFDIF